MNNTKTLHLIRDVIENEHGGVIYDEESDTSITPNWDSLIEDSLYMEKRVILLSLLIGIV